MEDLDTQVLRTAQSWFTQSVPSLLVTVARTWGSSPRPPGSLMAINTHGDVVGSVSGGCIEDDLIHRIRNGGVQAVCATGKPSVLRYGISAEEAHRFGLPCGGTVELVLEPVAEHSLLKPLLDACLQRQSTKRVLRLDSGHVQLSAGQRDGIPCLTDQELMTFFGPRARLILIGAGDLSRFMATMAQGMGFEVIVCDPREEHRSLWKMDGVQVSHEMPDDLILRIKPDARTAVVALTHDPKLDDLALIDALQSDAFYVGAIGSRRNSESRQHRLREHFGITQHEMDRLRSPAGLYIGSKTPAEIALSIMAEVVAAKNGVTSHQGAAITVGKAEHESSLGAAITVTSCGR